MSEMIDIVSPKAYEDLKKVNDLLSETIEKVGKVNSQMIGAKTPSQSDAGVKKLVEEYAKLEASIAKHQIQLEKYAQAQNRTKISNNQLEQSNIRLEKSIEAKNKALEREQAKLEASQNLYNKVQQKLNTLSNEYKNLAIRKELSGQLTEKEAQRYEFLQGRIQRYDQALKAVDASMGKYQRNVGNYASGFNSLGNSVNQLTREMPAFTYSVQTGFMALSNNIPIFTDAIKNAIDQNKFLQAEGKPTTSVLKQLAGAFFSWQTLLGVGITLLTVYGKEIGEFLSNTFKTSKGVDALKESQKQLNDVSQEGAKNAVEETLKLKSLLAIAKDTTLTYQQRMIAVKELQSTYPAYFDNLSTEKILAGQTAQAEKELTEAILSRAKANAAVTKITENQAKIIDIEIKKLEVQKQIDIASRNILKTEKELQSANNVTNSQGIALSQTYERRNKLTTELNELNKEKADLDKINNTLTSFALEKQKEAILLDYKEEKSKKALAKAKREDIEAVTLQTETQEGFLKRLKDQQKGFKDLQQQVSSTSQEFQDFQTIIDGLQQSIDLIEDPSKVIKSDGINEFMRVYSNRVKQGLEETKGFWEQHSEEVVELSQELVNTLAEISNVRFQNQFANLEKERDIAILFAGESVSAREEIERQYEQRRRAIERRQAEAQKKLAVFNIVTDTAQAIVASLLRDPTGTLAILIGAIGAAQLGIVLSQEIPQFWKGTDNAPEGLAWTQEKGREIITDKKGRIKSLGSDKGAQLTMLEKGDKVFTAQESSMIFDNGLNSILASNGISMPKVEVNFETEKITNSIKSLENVIANKEGLTIIENAKGRKVFLRKQNETKELLNSVINYKTIDV
jgi:DNA repair ATPase RecN